MKEKLTILYNYLKNNDHMQDANRIAKILDEYDKNGDLSELSCLLYTSPSPRD